MDKVLGWIAAVISIPMFLGAIGFTLTIIMRVPTPDLFVIVPVVCLFLLVVVVVVALKK
jgi:hypothetical protein